MVKAVNQNPPIQNACQWLIHIPTLVSHIKNHIHTENKLDKISSKNHGINDEEWLLSKFEAVCHIHLLPHESHVVNGRIQ